MTKNPSVLSTLAILKSNLDSGQDHIQMFMPFVLDIVASLPDESFTTAEVAVGLSGRLRLDLPSQTTSTLLNRAVKRGFLRREHRRYWKIHDKIPEPRLTDDAKRRLEDFLALGKSFSKYLESKSHPGATPEDAFERIVEFLDRNHVAMLLNEASPTQPDTSTREHANLESRLVARFIAEEVAPNPVLSETLKKAVQGFVLQKALLLKDVSRASRKFRNLRIFFDTRMILEALGYQGEPSRIAIESLIRALKGAGASVEVFCDTVNEIKSIFEVYKNHIGTASGRDALHHTALTRFFLSNQYSPSDVAVAIAKLEHDIQGMGIQVRARPQHVARYTLNEKDLSERLARGDTPDLEKRVWHDVNCVAAVLTIRENHTTDDLDKAKCIFATSTGLVVKHVTEWWIEQVADESPPHSSTRLIPPVIHQVALANHVWLKDPSSASSLKVNELIALCHVALQPSAATWDRFKKHLRKLQDSGVVTSDEMVVIMASQLTEVKLSLAEEEGEIDAETVEDVIETVRSRYAAEARAATEAARSADRSKRDLQANVASKADVIAGYVSRAIFGAAALLLAIIVYFFVWRPDLPLVRVVGAVLTFLNLAFGAFLYQERDSVRKLIADRARGWLVGPVE